MADNPKRCFVISPIGATGSVERKHADMTLNAIIRPALSESGTTLNVKRGDESAEIGMITDHMIAEILESDLIVADLSFLNPNVFYELGIAHSEEKPVTGAGSPRIVVVENQKSLEAARAFLQGRADVDMDRITFVVTGVRRNDQDPEDWLRAARGA